MLLILAGITADLHFHSFMSCFSEQCSKKSKAAAKHSTEGTDISFNKTPRVAEDAWVKLSEGFSNLFDREGKKMDYWRQEKARADGKKS